MHPYKASCEILIYVVIASSAAIVDLEKPRNSIIGGMLSNAALITSISKESINQDPEPSILQDISTRTLKTVNSTLIKSAEIIESGKIEAMNFSLLQVDSLSSVDLSQTSDGQTTQPLAPSFSGDHEWLHSFRAGKPVDSSSIKDSTSFMTMNPFFESLVSFTRMDPSLTRGDGSFATRDPFLIKDPGPVSDIITSSSGDTPSFMVNVSSRTRSDISFLPIEPFIGSITPNNLAEPNEFSSVAVRRTKVPHVEPLVRNQGIAPSIDTSFVATSDPFILNHDKSVSRGIKDSFIHGPTNGKTLSPPFVGKQTNVPGLQLSSDIPPWFNQSITLGQAIFHNPQSIGSLETMNHSSHTSNKPLSDETRHTIASHMSGHLEVPKTTIGEPSLNVFENLPLIGNIHETVWKIDKNSKTPPVINTVHKADAGVKGSGLPDQLIGAVSIRGDPVIVEDQELQQVLARDTARSNHSESEFSNNSLKPVSMSELLSLLNSKSDQIGPAGINFFNLETPINNRTHQSNSLPSNPL